MADRWQSQTLAGGPDVPPELRGDCFRACVASILNEPIESLPNPHDDWDAGWFDAMRKRNLQMVEANIEHWYPDGYWIAQLPSLNLPGSMHVVVMLGGDLIHDPSLGKKYTDEESLWKAGRGSVQRSWTIGPLDPVTATREQTAEGNANHDTGPQAKKPETPEPEKCEDCKGRGADEYKGGDPFLHRYRTRCKSCHGTGKANPSPPTQPDREQKIIVDWHLNGDGRAYIAVGDKTFDFDNADDDTPIIEAIEYALTQAFLSGVTFRPAAQSHIQAEAGGSENG